MSCDVYVAFKLVLASSAAAGAATVFSAGSKSTFLLHDLSGLVLSSVPAANRSEYWPMTYFSSVTAGNSTGLQLSNALEGLDIVQLTCVILSPCCAHYP